MLVHYLPKDILNIIITIARLNITSKLISQFFIEDGRLVVFVTSVVNLYGVCLDIYLAQ